MSHTEEDRHVVVVGAGPVGCLLATLLARRGFRVSAYERRPDMRSTDVSAGRSINLVLTQRGLRALEPLGLKRAVLDLTVPVLGRMMHSVTGELAYQPYGKDANECNHSVSRGELNEFLLTTAEQAGVELHFGHTLEDADLHEGVLRFACGGKDHHRVEARHVIGCDGAPSAVREALVQHHDCEASLDLIEHGYKELTFPAASSGGYALQGDALHIWPRSRHMLMALANRDGSFTGTIYLPWEGTDGFGTLQNPTQVQEFLERHYADAIPFLNEPTVEWFENPSSHLGTVRSWPWFFEDRALLVGDAAHGVVPFFGQGLNCGFEDCAEFDRLLGEADPDLAAFFRRFAESRKPHADAIADMALENFVEMRDRVGDPAFRLRKQVENRLEQRVPAKFRSRYALVVYSSIPYRTVQEIGEINRGILDRLCQGVSSPEDVDDALADRLIAERLTPFLAERGADLVF